MILNIIYFEFKNFFLELLVKVINCVLFYIVCIRWNILWIILEDEILERFNWFGWFFNFKSIMGIDLEFYGILIVSFFRCLSLIYRRDVVKIGIKIY